MIPEEIQFIFEKRDVGLSYVLWAKIDGGERWAIMEWGKKPSNFTIMDTKTIFIRSCHIYHKHLRFPMFRMKEVI